MTARQYDFHSRSLVSERIFYACIHLRVEPQAANRVREWYLLKAAQRCQREPPTEEDRFRQASEAGLSEWGLDLAKDERRSMFRYRIIWRMEVPKVGSPSRRDAYTFTHAHA